MNTQKRFTLREGWRIGTDPNNTGKKERWYQRSPGRDAPAIPVPGIIQQVFPGYHGVAWYWLEFIPETVPDDLERCSIHFGAVDYYAEVWLNGVRLGDHEGGETPFCLDASSALKPHSQNLLAVRVINPTTEPIDGFVLKEVPHSCKVVPYRVGAAYDHGGIVLPVEMCIQSAVRIVDVFVRPDPKTGTIILKVFMENNTDLHGQYTLTAKAGPAAAQGPSLISPVSVTSDIYPGEMDTEVQLEIHSPRLWSVDDPYLYRIDLGMKASLGKKDVIEQAYSVRCGFRDFRVGEDGYFYLNGGRIFLKSSHTGNHFPIGQRVPQNAHMLKKDLLYAKAAGFNMIRFIAGMAYPEQLDYCDEIGLMVYEECFAGWCLEDSPLMPERYDRSITEMILRDRNHPCVVIWGLLNETLDNPVFRHAVGSLPLIRSLDDTRLVLLDSGRWDCQRNIGSVSNPGRQQWQYVWGAEDQESPAAPPFSWSLGYPGGYLERVGDAHAYPWVPQTPKDVSFLRTLGADTKPVFLSEYGVGSMVDAIRTTRLFEQAGAPEELEDARLYRDMAEKYVADWKRYGMEGLYPFPEDLLCESQRIHARWRIQGFNAIRSNPQICGYNLTGTVDQAMAGEGLWTTWRELKPGIMDALADGLASLRWCLFVDPMHGYQGRSLKVEAVLATENALKPGNYTAWFRISGPKGIVWEKKAELNIPEPEEGKQPPLAFPVLREEVAMDGPAGEYCFAASMEKGAAPSGGRLRFYVSSPVASSRVKKPVTVLGVEDEVVSWLASRAVECKRNERGKVKKPEIVLAGDLGRCGLELEDWQGLAERIASGSVVIFLVPSAFSRGDDAVRWLPLVKKGKCTKFDNWLYHREDVAKRHPIFKGLQGAGLLDWDYYGQIIPQYLFEGQDTPDDVAAAAFAVGYTSPDGYASGLISGTYRLGAGCFIVNTLRILEYLDKNPAADRLLLNMIRYAASLVRDTCCEPEDFPELLRSIGFDHT